MRRDPIPCTAYLPVCFYRRFIDEVNLLADFQIAWSLDAS